MSEQAPRVVIVGGGFGGLFAARRLVRTRADVTVLDRSTSHVFQPLLYQCATGVLSEGQISRPLREQLAGHENVRTLLGEAHDVDPEARTLTVRRPDGSEFDLGWDYLVVATGMQQSYFGHPEFARHAPGMKTLDDAQAVRRRLYGAFEVAETLATAQERAEWLTFAVTGGGPTGVELAGQIREMATETLAREFHTIDPAEARVILIDGGDQVLRAFGPRLGARARRTLEQLGVELVMGVHVTGVDAHGITVTGKDGTESHHRVRTVLWTAGVEATPFARALATRLGASTDRAGRIAVEADLTVPGHPDVFVVGDLIDLDHLPGVAEVAMQGGVHAAGNIRRSLAGRTPARTPFRYRDLGSAAYISAGHAVVKAGPLQLSGRLGWLGWGLIHIAFLTGFTNRASTLVSWFTTIARGHRSQRAILFADPASAPQPYQPRAAARPTPGTAP